jgi:hypothetical protein
MMMNAISPMRVASPTRTLTTRIGQSRASRSVALLEVEALPGDLGGDRPGDRSGEHLVQQQPDQRGQQRGARHRPQRGRDHDIGASYGDAGRS